MIPVIQNRRRGPGIDTLLSDTFENASQRLFRFLHEHLPMQAWTITRVVDEEWVLLRVDDRGYGLEDNTVLRWADSVCCRLTESEGPYFLHDLNEFPAYRDAPVVEDPGIGAYFGTSLHVAGRELFGTLCGVDPEPQPMPSPELQSALSVMGELLSAVITLERVAWEASRQRADALEDASTDRLTGLANRRGWEERLRREEERLQVLAELAFVIVIDLDGLKTINDRHGHLAGDEFLSRTAEALKASVREEDFIARLGGDEFAVLGVGLDRAGANQLVKRMREALEQADIKASFGVALRRPSRTMTEAVALADRRMYKDKARRKARRES